MTRIDPAKLLGGHATGTLTEAERKALYAAALERQDLFGALMDEEALRELLADPGAKARLLGALAPTAAPKVVPLWRRTGVLGAAAGLLMASLAGLAYLRSPDKAAPASTPAPTPAPTPAAAPAPDRQAPIEKAKEAPAPAPTPVPAEAPAAPPPPASQQAAAPAAVAAVLADASREQALESRRAEARDNLAKKAEAPRPAAAAVVVEVVATGASTAKTTKRDLPAPEGAALAPGVVSGVVGGVVGGVAGGVVGGAASTPRRVEWKAGAAFKPTWTLEPGADGLTRLSVRGPEGASAVLLKRGAVGVAVVALERVATRGGMDHWRGQVRLADGEVLDLYLLNSPPAEPARLPESGPVDGFRARIHPAAK